MRNGFFSALFLALLVLGGLSLVLTDWNGMFRGGGITKTDVAVVNGTPIKIAEFNTTVNRILRNQRLDTKQAYDMGLIDNILQNEVLGRILDLSAIDYGISVEDKYVADQIQQLIAPLVAQGTDKKQALAQFLQMQGMSEKTLVQLIRSEIQSNMLKTSIGSASYIPSAMSSDIAAYKDIAKTIRYIELSNSDIKLDKDPDAQTLGDYYKTVERQYMMPEKRDFKIAILDTASVMKNIKVSDIEIAAYYDENKDTYQLPEKRTLEQAILKSESDANKVKAAAEKGKSLEDAVKSATGDKKSYAGKNDFAKSDLTPEMTTPVFSSKEGEYIGPIKSALGYHIIKLVKVKPEHIPPLAELKDEIKQHLIEDKSGNQVYELTSEIEDRLAGGEDFEALKGDYKIQILPFSSISASETKLDTGMELSEDQQKSIIQKAFTAVENEATTLSDLTDHQLYSIKVEKITLSAPKAFDDVKDQIAKRWKEENQGRKNLILAQKMTEELNEGKTQLDKTGKKVHTLTLSRNQESNKDLPETFKDPRVAGRFMDAPQGKFILSIPTSADAILIGEVTSVKMSEAQPSKEVANNLQADTMNANMMILVDHIQKKYPVEINHNLLKRVYGSSPDKE